MILSHSEQSEESMEEKKDILSAEDVKELQPLYAAVVSALKEVYGP